MSEEVPAHKEVSLEGQSEPHTTKCCNWMTVWVLLGFTFLNERRA
jgi:hypothetical protein